MFAATIGYWAHYDIPATRLLLKPLTYQIPNFSERKTMRTLRDYWNKKHPRNKDELSPSLLVSFPD